MQLETKRLFLEPFGPKHLEGLYAINSNPDIMRYIGPVQTLEDTREAITRMEERWERLGFGWWALIEKSSGELIGAACVQNAGHIEDAPLEIGWRLATSAQGKGYATEAGQAAMDFAFDRLNVDLVLAVADQKNTASHRVMQRLGMRYRGIETYYDQPLTTYEKYKEASV